jgi:hypothetical protein
MRLTAEQLKGKTVTINGTNPGEVVVADAEAGYVEVANRDPSGMLINYGHLVGAVVVSEAAPAPAVSALPKTE